MIIISQEQKTYGAGDIKGTVSLVLWHDSTPSSLAITGEDLGLEDDIAVGSMLMTPAKRYLYGEGGSFVELEW